jgi:hypothetical protein
MPSDVERILSDSIPDHHIERVRGQRAISHTFR